MLQDFLTHNLLTIKDDAHIEKLEEASQDIAAKIKIQPQKIITYTLAALDHDTPANNPDFIEVKSIISQHWKTFANNSKDTPITYLRAVMLEALKIVSEEDVKLAALIWLTGRNIFKHLKIIGEEKVFIGDFILSLGKKVQKEAAQNWAVPSAPPTTTAIQKLVADIKTIAGVTIDKALLQKRLEDASGPQNASGVANFASPNNCWPNSAHSWSYQFAPRAAQAIEEVINKALKEQTDKLVSNQMVMKNTINQLLLQVHTQLEHARLEQTQNQAQLQLQWRTQMLLWKETCYSESLDASYREQPNGVLQTLLASDYSTYIPTIYPTSVDYFLKETHRPLVENADAKLKISDFLNEIEQHKTILKSILQELNIKNKRNSLLNFVKGLVWGKCATSQFNDLVGFSADTEITLAECTLWLFHDFQALKIANNK
jgi:GTPase-associated system helical domain